MVKKIYLPLIIVFSLFILSCATTKYVCSDGTVADDPSLCPGGEGVEVKEPCVKQEAYTVEVPYNDTEFYYVWEGAGTPYCNEKTYTDYDYEMSRVGNTCIITVTNTGDLTGNWTIHVKFIDNQFGGGPESESITHELAPGEKADFSFEYTGENILQYCKNINDEVPVVRDCKYPYQEKVRKAKLVVRYKNETRYRNVTC